MANIELICRECKAEARVEKCRSASARGFFPTQKKGLYLCGHYSNRRHHLGEHLAEMYPPWLSLSEESLSANSTSLNIQQFIFHMTPSSSASFFPAMTSCNSRLNATPRTLPCLPALERLSPLLPHTLHRTPQDAIIQSIHYFAFANLPVINP